MFSESHTAQQEEVKMASNIVQCLLVATLAVVTMHPRAVFTFSAHLPNSLLLDTPDALEAAADDHQNDQSGEQSNIILLNSNNINSKRMLLDTNSPGSFVLLSAIIIRISLSLLWLH